MSEKILIHEVWAAPHDNLGLARTIARRLEQNWPACNFQVDDTASDEAVRVYYLATGEEYEHLLFAEMRGFAQAVETLLIANF